MKQFNSVWGAEDQVTLDLIKKSDFRGRWLDLAAGDGRYADKIIQKTDLLVAADINPDYLEQLRTKIDEKYQKKLLTTAFDFLKPFPFPNDFFDGVFCTGALHLFSEGDIEKIILEVKRVLKKNGEFIFDFATDIRRIKPDGSLHQYPSRIEYTLREAESLMIKLLNGFKYSTSKSKVIDQPVSLGDRNYNLNCNFFLIKSTKT